MDLCPRKTILTLLLIFYNISAHADTCPGPNAQKVEDFYFNLTYESWVHNPASPAGLYTYGRCVITLNSQSMYIDWIPAQLKGITAPSIPVWAEFPFPSPTTREISSEFHYGFSNPPDHLLNVYFVASDEETVKHSTTSNSPSSSPNWRAVSQQEDAVSRAQLLIPDDTGKPTIMLAAKFVSFANAPKYRLDISFATSASDKTVSHDLFVATDNSDLNYL